MGVMRTDAVTCFVMMVSEGRSSPTVGASDRPEEQATASGRAAIRRRAGHGR